MRQSIYIKFSAIGGLILFTSCMGWSQSSKGQASTSRTCFSFNESETEIAAYFRRDTKTNQPCPNDVVIPNGVTRIGAFAFSDLYQNYTRKITSVVIPNSVTEIGTGAFANNKLAKVIIPNSVKYIGIGAFENNQLISVTIGSGVTRIDEYAFANNKLAKVIIPDSVKYIGDSAFENNELISLTIVSGVAWIGNRTFARNKLISVTLSKMSVLGFDAFSDNPLASVCFKSSTGNFIAYDFKKRSVFPNDTKIFYDSDNNCRN